MNRIAIRLSLSLLLLTVLSACGFHLRGQVTQLHSIPQPIYVTGIEPYSPLGKKVQQQLRQAGVSLTDVLDQAETILRISKVSERQRTLSLDARNKEAEIELEESLHFSLRSPQQGELVPDQALRVVRTLYKPQDQVLAGLQEQKALRDDMRRELVNLMIRQLAIKF